MSEQDDLLNVVNVVNELDYVSKEKGLNIDCWGLYRNLYKEHGEKYGRFTKYVGTIWYERNMNKRYDYIIEKINCNIEDKVKQQ